MDYLQMYGPTNAFLVHGPFLFALLLWSLAWKGIALWHSARRKDSIWFVVILVVNTLGILEMIYLFAFAKIPPGKLLRIEEHRDR